MSNNFNMSFDNTTRQEFANVLADYGLTVPQAFKLFANQVIKTKTVPLSFDWQAKKSQVELTEQVLAIIEQNQVEQSQGKSTKYANFDEMMADLKNE